MRPIVEIMTVNFSLLALDQIVNNAATIPHMSGGQFAVPLVIRMATGGGRQVAAQHSHSLEGWYAHIPGLRVLAPAIIEDARGMLAAALADPNPVLIFEHVMLYNMEGALDPAVTAVDIAHAAMRRDGTRRHADHLWRRAVEGAGRRRHPGRGRHRGRSHRSARPAAARHRNDPGIGRQDAARRHRRRGLAQRHRWRPRSACASPRTPSSISTRRSRRVCGARGADAVRAASRRRRAAAAGRHRRGGANSRARQMSDFLMPALGADMEAGTLVEWLVKPGDRVKKGDIVAVVETQKGAIEVEIFDEGIVSELVVPVGTKIPVGGVLAHIADGKPAQSPRAAPTTPAEPRRTAPEIVQPLEPAPVLPALAGTKVTPAARRRAAELGIDASALAGTGIDGAVTLADIELAARTRATVPPAAAVSTAAAAGPRRAGFDLAEMRKAIATAMGRSKREIPHYYLSHTVDLGAALGWLEAFNAARPVSDRLLPAVLLLKATALALREVPQLNGTYIDGAFRPGDGVHVGWAISLRSGGLVAPAIRDADKRSLTELMAAMRDLVQRARTGGLRSSELASPTVTVTSLGERGAETRHRNHLSAAGRDHRLRHGPDAPLGCGRAGRAAASRFRHARGRSPGD